MTTDDLSGLKIPFGMRENGIMIGAEEPNLPNGLACNCFCPVCRARLVARNHGEVYRSHFAHEASASGSRAIAEGCANAGETSIHLMAKQIIADYFAIRLPQVVAFLPPSRTRIIFNNGSDLYHRFGSVRLEEWCDGFRPDIIGTYAGNYRDGLSRPFALIGEDVVVEIMVTHACDPVKIGKLRDRKLAAFEIDLSKFEYDLTEDSVRSAINNAPRAWLYHPIIDKALANMLSEEDGETVIDDPERAERGAERWRQVVMEVQAKAAAEGRIVYV